MKIKIENVRLAFPALFEPKTVNGEGDPRFSAVFILDPSSVNVTLIRDAIATVAKEKWGAKADAILKELANKDRICYAPRGKTNQSGDIYDGFEGMHYINASNTARPLVLDRDASPLTAADGRPYAGCYVYASLELWAQDNNYGKRVNASLRGVQFYRDGDAFSGGGVASIDEFAPLEDGAAAAAGWV